MHTFIIPVEKPVINDFQHLVAQNALEPHVPEKDSPILLKKRTAAAGCRTPKYRAGHNNIQEPSAIFRRYLGQIFQK